jgi:hypothetical protein
MHVTLLSITDLIEFSKVSPSHPRPRCPRANFDLDADHYYHHLASQSLRHQGIHPRSLHQDLSKPYLRPRLLRTPRAAGVIAHQCAAERHSHVSALAFWGG